ncbi:MAG: tRNA-specific 2-thiouridylase MnmA [Calditrichaeota bacterium]|nr:tRNA-specific 2-thiouridylase MnmA [Calditrichota bacterium]
MAIKTTEKRVGVLMSGGVDSSVAAALLKRKGYHVVGVTLQLWDYETNGRRPPGERGCCDISHQMDARFVCHHLGVEHVVLDLRDAFRRAVVGPYENAYLSGRTPNPCIACNTHIKWAEVIRRAPVFGLDFIATGHYARVVRGRDGVRLEKGVDRAKDQSYALWQIPRHVLARTIFPLGTWTKRSIREEARQLGLRTADKPESQEVCFIDGRYDEHLREEYADRVSRIGAGEIVDTAGRTLGGHSGFFSFTIGQRKGLDISDGRGPYYVTELDAARNRVVVGDRRSLARTGLVAVEPNWVSFDPPERPERCAVKVRYNDPAGAPATVHPPEDGRVLIRFDNPVDAVTPGQSAVWYRGNAVWGGGIISRALKDGDAAADSHRMNLEADW